MTLRSVKCSLAERPSGRLAEMWAFASWDASLPVGLFRLIPCWVAEAEMVKDLRLAMAGGCVGGKEARRRVSG